METSCCGDYASVPPTNLVTAMTTMTAEATATVPEKESIAMAMLFVVFIVLFYGSIFVLCFVMYPKLPEESDGDEESGDRLPASERFGARAMAEVCVICLEDLKRNDIVRVLVKCKHVFHVRCIDSWCLYRLACPICRAPFRLFDAW
ncbi:PREDICTED: RING-H2 finger protein ATL64 [Tarenaya hassleriana]|uniref:RING-H2 finger protein ATL64 n=1 Tax=Tarenaya hassleriana TaxID=28532 RepID=UPI00053C69B8|nr:PREDICTED: RING-H2 finger protein ATL64 [Tarenaya hassleriana]